MINIKGISMNIGGFSLRNLNLIIQDKEYLVILGPTGAGKTVFMECMAGLHKIKHGEIWIDKTNITHFAPEERKIGYVPQDYVLFPFLNVQENILFGLKRGKYKKQIIQQRLVTLVDLLGIKHLLDRNTSTLSGGEKQRVALARALATSPKILLMDEPFSALDVQTSKYLRLELRRIHQELGVTTIHITHNYEEADELADRIAVMSSGEIMQVGKPNDIFFSPGNEDVSKFIGSPNILDCEFCRQLVPGLMEVDCGGMHILVYHDEERINKIAISPRDIYISDVLPPGPSVNRYQGIITNVEFESTLARMNVKVSNINLSVELPGELAKEMGLMTGKSIYLILRLRKLKVLGNQNDKYKYHG
jgi:ABC-type sugar transport system ATPase subunit